MKYKVQQEVRQKNPSVQYGWFSEKYASELVKEKPFLKLGEKQYQVKGKGGWQWMGYDKSKYKNDGRLK